MVALDLVIAAFVVFIGGVQAYYSIYALVFVIVTAVVFYNISTH